jgi:hypothetical protein
MGDQSQLLKSWIASKPTQVDNGVILQMFKVMVRALDENDKEYAQLKAEVNALSASLGVAENQITTLQGRVTVMEQKG